MEALRAIIAARLLCIPAGSPQGRAKGSACAMPHVISNTSAPVRQPVS